MNHPLCSKPLVSRQCFDPLISNIQKVFVSNFNLQGLSPIFVSLSNEMIYSYTVMLDYHKSSQQEINGAMARYGQLMTLTRDKELQVNAGGSGDVDI